MGDRGDVGKERGRERGDMPYREKVEDREIKSGREGGEQGRIQDFATGGGGVHSQKNLNFGVSWGA